MRKPSFDALSRAVQSNVEIISPANLNATVSFFKEFGREQQAREILQFYLDHRSGNAEFWDLEESPLNSQVTDQEVRSAFQAKRSAVSSPFDAEATLIRIGSHKGVYKEEVAKLARLTSADYFRIFKKLKGDNLRYAVGGSLYFRAIGNADENMKAVTASAEAALREIARENRINRSASRILE
jgi:hypothetical protein